MFDFRYNGKLLWYVQLFDVDICWSQMIQNVAVAMSLIIYSIAESAYFAIIIGYIFSVLGEDC